MESAEYSSFKYRVVLVGDGGPGSIGGCRHSSLIFRFGLLGVCSDGSLLFRLGGFVAAGSTGDRGVACTCTLSSSLSELD